MEWQNILRHRKTESPKTLDAWLCKTSLTNGIADFFETLEENLEENFPFFIQVMMKQV